MQKSKSGIVEISKEGFTFIELAIVIALLAAISVAVLLGLTDYRGGQNLKLTMNELITVIRDTQKRSITQEDGGQWGMRFANSGGSDSRYTIFKGPDFDSGVVEKVYPLSRGIKFSEPSVSRSHDMIFAPVSGNLSGRKIISLVGGRKDFTVGDIIVSAMGLIISRIEGGVFGYWHFDEGSGNAVNDASTGERHALLNGSQDWRGGSECKSGGCLSFQPPSDFIAGSLDEPVILSQFTIETWIKLRSDQEKAGVWTGYDTGFQNKISGLIRFQSYRKPSFFTKDDAGGEDEISTTLALQQLDRWYHLAYVYDGIDKKIYINGEKDTQHSLPGKFFTIYSFDIARSEHDNNYALNGFLDEVRFYQRSLSDDEILSHYNDLK